MANRPTFRLPHAYRGEDPGQAAWNLDVIRALRELQQLPILQGVMITDVDIGTADTSVKHKLGRAPTGLWVVNQTANTVIWQPAAPTSSVIHLQAGTDVVADIWIF